MPEQRRWVMWVVLGLAGAGASALALSTPQDETRFVSRSPSGEAVGEKSQPGDGGSQWRQGVAGALRLRRSETAKAASSNSGARKLRRVAKRQPP